MTATIHDPHRRGRRLPGGAAPRPRRRRIPGGGRRPDRGSILVLTLGYAMIALSLVVVVTDVSAVYLARRSLAADCDGAALAAAQSADRAALYRDDGSAADSADTGPRLPLTGVQAAVDRYDPSLTARLRDADTVEVTGRRTVRLPLVGLLGLHPVTVVARSAAQLVRAP